MTDFKTKNRSGISRHTLVVKTRVAISHAKRDLDLISDYGIDLNFLENTESKINYLESLPLFKTLKAESNAITREREEARLVLTKELQKSKRRFSLIFPAGSAIYNDYMLGSLTKGDYKAFSEFAGNMISGFEKNIDALTGIGFTEETVSELKTKVADFNAKYVAKKSSSDNSDTPTEERYAAMNAVYSDLIQICKAGKALWIDESSAKYNDYIIYR